MEPIYGQLSVNGKGQLVGQNGKPVQLRGVSTHGLQWFPQFYNWNSFKWLRDDWKLNVIRIAVYVEEGGYTQDGGKSRQLALEAINWCLGLNLYVIIDWHVSADEDPQKHKVEALKFFREISVAHPNDPHIIYEIMNEPHGSGDDWRGKLKPYAEQAIGVIRAASPNAVVIVGNPMWSQRPDVGMTDPLGDKNVLYTNHRYCRHETEQWQKMVANIRTHGVPVFATEAGVSDYTGNGGPFLQDFEQIIRFYEEHDISWAVWSLCDKNETSALLLPGAPTQGGWGESWLTPGGRLVRKMLRELADKTPVGLPDPAPAPAPEPPAPKPPKFLEVGKSYPIKIELDSWGSSVKGSGRITIGEQDAD